MGDDEDKRDRRLPPPPPTPEWAMRRPTVIESMIAMENAQELAVAAHSLLVDINIYRDWFAEVRALAISELHADGWSYDAIGQLLGLTKSRVQQIKRQRERGVHALDELEAGTVGSLATDDVDNGPS